MRDMAKVTQRKLSDYQQDPANANAGTERGVYMLEHSLEQFGAGRSLLADKNGVLLAGNKTQQSASDLGITDVIEVETDGTQLVVVKRTDLDLTQDEDNRARGLAYADNRAGEVGLAWDAGQLLADANAGIDLGQFWREDELEALLNGKTWDEAFGGLTTGDKPPFQQMTFTLHDSQAAIVQKAIRAAMQGGFENSPNENSNGNALTRICEAYLG